MSIEDLQNQEGSIKWSKIELESCHMPSGLSIKTNFYIGDNTKKEIAYIWDRQEKDSVELLNEIKKEMYK
jgi:hypothetical protein